MLLALRGGGWVSIFHEKSVTYPFKGPDIKTYIYLYLLAGFEGELEAALQHDHGATVHPEPSAGALPQAALLSLLLPLSATGTEEVPHAGLEHPL